MPLLQCIAIDSDIRIAFIFFTCDTFETELHTGMKIKVNIPQLFRV